MTNCPNCGAPIQGDICEYCGTVFNKPSGNAAIAEEASRLLENGLITANEARSRMGLKRIPIWEEYIKVKREMQQTYDDLIKDIQTVERLIERRN